MTARSSAVVALLVLVGVAGCTDDAAGPAPAPVPAPVLDTRAVERDVADQFSEGAVAGVIVDCPDRMEIEVGATYECPARVIGERSTTLVLTVTDEEGAYTWAEA